ncbi:MAG: FAD-dependent hydroxylase [Synechococcales cyanobacterium T60_A2020_003]|nr:FAD-dependent hydroxylase [Synechococcales cyanobacterium T60_A2020_003]
MVLNLSAQRSASIPTQSQGSPDPAQSDSVPLDFDVAIAGAGIVGLTLACALQQSGLRIALIEAQTREMGLRRNRAYAITLLSGRIFDGLGVWDNILPHITTFQTIQLSEGTFPEVVNLQPSDLGTPALGYVAEHHVLVRALQAKLDADGGINWLCPATLRHADYQPDYVDLTIDLDGEERQVRTRLLVAADGVRSPIRQAAGIQTQGWPYWQSCVTAVIRSEIPHGNVAREHFWPGGPFATLPLPGNRCQIVLTAPHDEAKAWVETSEQAFLEELNRRYSGHLGRLELVGDRFLFPVQLMQSQRYTQHRLALVGDAAHCCHPVGGQGMNLGIRDAAALAQVIQTAAARGEDIGAVSVLKRYGRWRKLENLVILGFTDFLDRLFSTQWGPVVVVRRTGLWMMRRIRWMKYLALRLMTGLSGQSPRIAQR